MPTKLRTYPHSFWSPMKVKKFSTIDTPIAAISIIALSIGLYCKCFGNRKSCACTHTTLTSISVNYAHIELQPIVDSLPYISDQLSPQIIHKVFKASGVIIIIIRWVWPQASSWGFSVAEYVSGHNSYWW